MAFTVYAPKDRDSLPEGIPRGAALLRVGRVLQMAAPTMPHESFADVCRRAISQGSRLDPQLFELVEVGFFDEFEGTIKLSPGRDRILNSWIGRVAYRNDLEASDSRHNTRMAARQEFRRAYMRGDKGRAAAIAQKHQLRGW